MKWLIVILLSILSILFLEKGIELWTVINHVDGDGIGISFIGMSISERVLIESIPGYALGFTIASLIPILVAINLALRLKPKKNMDTTNI
ncbi:MAG: hypothetical protein WB217_08570 [Mesobacillus sp.]|uniref:hypothetical protein n=1 Tax=Mesobacillus sp. TaxID=2675271 RepID=UPI003C58D8E9